MKHVFRRPNSFARGPLSRLLIALFFASVIVRGAQRGTYADLFPVDEASQQADFFSFRARLQAAIASRDSAAVLSVVSANIKNNLGGDDGRQAFERLWRLDSPDSLLWEALGRVLALGGSFESNGTFVAPYTFSEWPQNADAFEHVAVIGSRVRVREAPSRDSGTLALVSFAILPIARDLSPAKAEQAGEWTAVRLQDGRIGHVASQYVRSPIDYRAVFARAGDEWQLVMFLAGD